jgi:hypothetical protein
MMIRSRVSIFLLENFRKVLNFEKGIFNKHEKGTRITKFVS